MAERLAFLGILFVLFATLLGVYFTTRWYASRMLSSSRLGNTQKLSLVYRLPLGREQNIVVVRVGTRHFMLGCTPQNISLLAELSGEENDLFSLENRYGEDSKFLDFSQLLRKVREEKDEETIE